MRPISVKWYRLLIIALLRKRDGSLCGICKKYVSDLTASIDHIKQLKDGGALLDPVNVRLAHLDCNKRRPRGRRSSAPELYMLYRKWKETGEDSDYRAWRRAEQKSDQPRRAAVLRHWRVKSRLALYEREQCEISRRL